METLCPWNASHWCLIHNSSSGELVGWAMLCQCYDHPVEMQTEVKALCFQTQEHGINVLQRLLHLWRKHLDSRTIFIDTCKQKEDRIGRYVVAKLAGFRRCNGTVKKDGREWIRQACQRRRV